MDHVTKCHDRALLRLKEGLATAATRAANRAARLPTGLPWVAAPLSDDRSDAAGTGAFVASATTGAAGLGTGLAFIKAARSSPSAFSPSVSHLSMLAAILSVSCDPDAPRKSPHSSKYGFINMLRERRAQGVRRVRRRAREGAGPGYGDAGVQGAGVRGAGVRGCRGAGREGKGWRACGAGAVRT